MVEKMYESCFGESISPDLKKDVLNKPLEFRYQMLGRFQSDADYFFRNPSPKHLWAGDPIEHADNMVAVYNTFSREEKPEWLTDRELKDYVRKLKSMKEKVEKNEEYTSYYKEPLFECGFCGNCSSRYMCESENLSIKCKKMNEAIDKFNDSFKLEEECPIGTKPKSGGCTNSDGNSYRRGVCDSGYTWSASSGSTGKCIHKTDDTKHQPRSER